MFPKRTHLKTDNQAELNPKLDDTAVDKTIKKIITLKNLLTHMRINLDHDKTLVTSETSTQTRNKLKITYKILHNNMFEFQDY